MTGLNDENVGADAVAAGYIDEDWAEQFAGQDEAGEEAPRVSGQTIPTFPYYVLQFDKGKGAVSANAKTPMARVSAVVVEGPAGTVGERVFDDLFLRVSKTTFADGVKVQKEAEKYGTDLENFRKKLNKIARVGGFELSHPTGASIEALDAYAKQFERGGDGFLAIAEVRESSDTYQGVTRIRNRIIWESLRSLDEPATSKKAKPGTNAYDEAVEQIAARNKSLAGKAGGDGRTAGSVAGRGGKGALAD